MDWGALLFVLAIGVLAGLYVALPIVQRQGQTLTEEEHTRSALLARREQVLTTLAELEFDRELGKIDDEHYQTRRQALLQEGAKILRELDALKHAPAVAADDAKKAVETMLAKRRAQKETAAAEAEADDDIEALLAARRRARQAKSSGFCPKCGVPVLATDRFCPRCGTPLARE